MRSTFFSLSAHCLLAVSAHASVIYNLSLNSPSGPYQGTGSITLAYAPSTTGITNYASTDSSNLFFKIDGQTFSTASGGTVGAVQFQDGSVRNITFSQQIGTSPNRYALQITNPFAFSYNNLQTQETGTIGSSLAPAATAVTPEPSSFALLATGLVGVGGVLRKRFA